MKESLAKAKPQRMHLDLRIPMFLKEWEKVKSTSQKPYKPNAFPMIVNPFLASERRNLA